jgi:hypothetical protein
MFIQNKGTVSQMIDQFTNAATRTVLPGNIIDVPSNQYQGLKDQNSNLSEPDNDVIEQCVDVTLTSAQILALNTTPVALIRAQGATNAVVVNKVIMSQIYKSAAYTSNTTLGVYADLTTAGDAAGSSVTAAKVAGLLTATNNLVQVVSGLGATETTAVLNKGISIKADTGNPVRQTATASEEENAQRHALYRRRSIAGTRVGLPVAENPAGISRHGET